MRTTTQLDTIRIELAFFSGHMQPMSLLVISIKEAIAHG